jgi:hypothetical protein
MHAPEVGRDGTAVQYCRERYLTMRLAGREKRSQSPTFEPHYQEAVFLEMEA